MQVLITGVGDAFTTRHFGSSALLRAPDAPVLIDCPDLVHRALRCACEVSGWSVDASDIHDIVLTHLHGDHCNGLESFAFRRAVERAGGSGAPRPRLHTHAGAAERLWERLAPAMDAPAPGASRPATIDDYFDLRVFQAGESFDVAGCTIDTRPTFHPVPTIGLRIRAGGASLGWSGDTRFDPDHVAWLDETDLFVHETNVGPVHTEIGDLNALPDRVRAKMRLIHMADDFDPACTDIVALREGDVLHI